jgi:hypothetical protein
MSSTQPPAVLKLDDLLDAIVAEYQDRIASGGEPKLDEFLSRAPAEHRAWIFVHCLPEHAALDCPRVSDEIEVGIRLPSFPREALSALFGGYGRIGARVGVREDRIGVLVERNVGG